MFQVIFFEYWKYWWFLERMGFPKILFINFANAHIFCWLWKSFSSSDSTSILNISWRFMHFFLYFITKCKMLQYSHYEITVKIFWKKKPFLNLNLFGTHTFHSDLFCNNFVSTKCREVSLISSHFVGHSVARRR